MRIVEAFSGIGSQAKALKQLSKELNFDYEIVNTIEWDINSIFSYDLIHNGKPTKCRIDDYSREKTIEELSKLPLSYDGTTLMEEKQYNRYQTDTLKAILKSIERTNNLVSIKDVNLKNFPRNIDVLTYSFPCQDLSLSGYFHGDTKGIQRDANNSSSLLWEVERILFELKENNVDLPKILIMENVASILSNKHIDDFKSWISSLESLGYYSHVEVLNAMDFGIPQHRKRAFMISVLHDNDELLKSIIKQNLQSIVDSSIVPTKLKLKKFLKTDYSNPIYRQEAIESVPNYTPSRKDIHDGNLQINIDDKGNPDVVAVRTITTRQDRHPNSCVIHIDKNDLGLDEIKAPYRFLTPRESFLLMGFDEKDYDTLLKYNLPINDKYNFLTNNKLLKLSGNSIVVNVIKEVFRKAYNIYLEIEKYNKKEPSL